LPDLRQIYQSEAERYHTLVSREDTEHNLLPAIRAIDPLDGKTVIELCAGTGRVSRLIAPFVRRLVISDISHHMLSFSKGKVAECGMTNWYLSLESHQALPFADQAADVVIAGWSFCYAAIDVEEAWRIVLEQALREMQRILCPGGRLILIESLGTGYETPHPPQVLVKYLNYLDAHGFESTWIRTDYCFKEKAEARALTSFFFGDDPLPMWETGEGVIVPECTGLWWQSF